ncbi:disulfide bond formation protein B [Beggiatoa leptomitoformis]|uniref:Disulfide bond formation protein B n=1 Tax=Beggiatoa leptomitoformis TaxID=288004 RepID=A0A2N9YHV6_9GAMM|nr:disulfide bond formation protein B [Beggiatoa leptomitoformis]ALG69413.2 disulfide bond formation protein B [Beggiatoa leptomitoformis]AUI69979.1 disulfide bond formation protein B [Beggiatoa leptomitoformis]
MLQNILSNRRSVYAFIFLACVALMITAYFFQYVMGLEPCPLCMAQRLIMISIGLIALVGLLHGSFGWANKIYSVLLFLFAVGGMSVAGRQVWLQSLPADQVPACGPDFEFMVNNFPILKTVEVLWRGSGSCAEVSWEFLGLSIAGWTFIWFTFFAMLAIYQLIKRFTPAKTV